MKIVDRIRKKLKEFGMEIFDEHLVEDSEYIFYVENMILFVEIKNEEIGISFQATTLPEQASNITLILNSLGYKLYIMESFIYDTNNKCITGNKAFELIKKTDQLKAVKEYVKEQTFTEMLMAVEEGHGHQC